MKHFKARITFDVTYTVTDEELTSIINHARQRGWSLARTAREHLEDYLDFVLSENGGGLKDGVPGSSLEAIQLFKPYTISAGTWHSVPRPAAEVNGQ